MNKIVRISLLTAIMATTTALLQGCFGVAAVGVGTAAAIATDRRTSENYIADEAIEIRSINRINDKYRGKVHINVTSYNGKVLVTGEVPDDTIKAGVEQIVTGVPNVKSVVNELSVGGISSLASRGNDTYLTGAVKARFAEAQKFQINYVKVVTEAGAVYLMGLVTQAEADQATRIASTTSGVRRVVKVFEYITSDEARRRELTKQPADAQTQSESAQ